MKKLNEVIYNKIVIQANEAKELGFEKLAEEVLSVVGPVPREEEISYSLKELEANVKNNLWKIALEYINYHDLNSVDIQKVDAVLNALVPKVAHAIEQGIEADGFGPLEPKLFGQKA